MNANEIRMVGDPVLRTPTAPVTAFGPGLVRLVEAMFAAMQAAGGVGLAANQIGVDAAVFVMDFQGERAVVVNPVLVVPTESPVITDMEGCLSLPGRHHATPRSARAEVTGQDLDGRAVRVAGEGLVARCLQHEVDHLGGVLYLDRLPRGDRARAWREALIDPVA